MATSKLIHVCDSSIHLDRLDATKAVFSKLFPSAEIQENVWDADESDEDLSDAISRRIEENSFRIQLLFTNITGMYFLIPHVQKLQKPPAIIISSCVTRRKMQKAADALQIDIGGIPNISSTQDSLVAREEELRYSDKVCIALSELGLGHPLYVHPATYKYLRALEVSSI